MIASVDAINNRANEKRTDRNPGFPVKIKIKIYAFLLFALWLNSPK